MLLYLDCRSGVSGDMTLAAMAHLGLDLAPLQNLLREAGIDCTLRSWTESRAAGPGCRVEVAWENPQPLRHPSDIEALFRSLAVGDAVRKRALEALRALAEAEAHAHGIPVEEVHFHEVGAIDTLVDILGAAWGMAQLGVTEVLASPLPWFSGTVRCAHGLLPLPAPATAFLLQGKPVFATGATTELITPTGAAIVHSLADRFADAPSGVIRGLGTGYGSRPSPSGLRAWLLEPGIGEPHGAAAGTETVAVLETHLDHLTGEELGAALEALAALPDVLDVLWLPGVTKKNRPGGALRVLCLPPHLESVGDAVFRHTHTLGIRRQVMERVVLAREGTSLSTPYGRLAAKGYTLENRRYIRAESDALRAAAAAEGVGVPGLRFAPDTEPR